MSLHVKDLPLTMDDFQLIQRCLEQASYTVDSDVTYAYCIQRWWWLLKCVIALDQGSPSPALPLI